MQWNNELKKWLKEIPDEYDIRYYGIYSYKNSRSKPKTFNKPTSSQNLTISRWKGLKSKLTSTIRKLAERAGLTATNPDTTYLFIKGLTDSYGSIYARNPFMVTEWLALMP